MSTSNVTKLKREELPEIELTQAVVDEVCNEILNGCSVKLALMRVARGKCNLVGRFTYQRLIARYQNQLEIARTARATRGIEDCHDVARLVRLGRMDLSTGKFLVNTYLALAAKDDPRRYGERIDLTVTKRLEVMDDDEILAKLAEIGGHIPEFRAALEAVQYEEIEEDESNQ